MAVPISRDQRIEALDVLRGVAIFGILIANMLVTSGYVFMDPAGRSALPTSGVDGAFDFAIHMLVEGKFYSIFSLLFGIGFAVQMRRAETSGIPFPPFFRRRLTGLLLIGLVHAVLIWAGDILLLYALLGFLLVPFRHASDRAVLRAALICLALPIGVYLLLLMAGAGGTPAGNAAMEQQQQQFLDAINAGLQDGSWRASFRANLLLLLGRWVDLFLSVRFPKVFGMFLVGFYFGRRGLGLDPVRDRPLLVRAVLVGLLVGLPANAIMAWLAGQDVYLPASGLGLVYTIAAAVGLPLLALGISAGVALALVAPTGRRVLGPVGAAGRMALTNYLMHSIIMTALFYGWGLAWYLGVGPAFTTLLALGICLAQVPLSMYWLARHRFGPVEWVWRQFSYRQRLALRRVSAEG